MTVGEPSGFTSAMLLPVTSARTLANFSASWRQTLAGAPSNPEGPGVSSSFLRNCNASSLIILYWLFVLGEYSTALCISVTYARANSQGFPHSGDCFSPASHTFCAIFAFDTDLADSIRRHVRFDFCRIAEHRRRHVLYYGSAW